MLRNNNVKMLIIAFQQIYNNIQFEKVNVLLLYMACQLRVTSKNNFTKKCYSLLLLAFKNGVCTDNWNEIGKTFYTQILWNRFRSNNIET